MFILNILVIRVIHIVFHTLTGSSKRSLFLLAPHSADQNSGNRILLFATDSHRTTFVMISDDDPNPSLILLLRLFLYHTKVAQTSYAAILNC